jgi:hypothetical protein
LDACEALLAAGALVDKADSIGYYPPPSKISCLRLALLRKCGSIQYHHAYIIFQNTILVRLCFFLMHHLHALCSVLQVYTPHAGCSRESLSCSSSTCLLPICIEKPHLPSSGTHCEITFSINHDISKAHSISIIDENSLKCSHFFFCYSQLLYNSKASLLLKDSLLHKVIHLSFACALHMPHIPFQTAQELAQMKGRYASTFSIRTSNATRHSHSYVCH